MSFFCTSRLGSGFDPSQARRGTTDAQQAIEPKEVTDIIAHACELDQEHPQSGAHLSLSDLAFIGDEVGLGRDVVFQALATLDATRPGGDSSFWGGPTSWEICDQPVVSSLPLEEYARILAELLPRSGVVAISPSRVECTERRMRGTTRICVSDDSGGRTLAASADGLNTAVAVHYGVVLACIAVSPGFVALGFGLGPTAVLLGLTWAGTWLAGRSVWQRWSHRLRKRLQLLYSRVALLGEHASENSSVADTCLDAAALLSFVNRRA